MDLQLDAGPYCRTSQAIDRCAPGWGGSCSDLKQYSTVKNKSYPLWNAADYRATCSGTIFLPQTVLDNETLHRDKTDLERR